MKYLLMFAVLASGCLAQAHDEGHGPKLTSDVPLRGGVLAPVIESRSVTKGAKAEVIFKAELTRESNGNVRIYLFDSKMKALDLSSFDAKAIGTIEFKKNRKWNKKEFEFIKDASGFIANSIPRPSVKPYNIEVSFKAGGKALLAAFEKLD